MANHVTQHHSSSSSSSSSSNVAVVMVPLPAQSHLNQLLQLSHIISSYNIEVHYACSAVHVSQVKSRSTTRNPSPNIHFHELPTPDFPSPPPTSAHYFPSHLLPCFESSVELRRPVRDLLVTLSETSRRLVVVYDPFMSYVVQDALSLANVEIYYFNGISAAQGFANLRNYLGLKIKEEIPYFEGTSSPEFVDFKHRNFEYMFKLKKSGALYNNCRVLEGEFIDLCFEKVREADENMKIWACGPWHMMQVFDGKPSNTHKDSHCLEWLDKQEPNSVLYISFGTTTCMDDDQVRELAKGLEESGEKFIWVLRDADKGNVMDGSEVRRYQLPQGFEDRVEGIVVREWAPQLEILGHPSTGGFMSHCGWNSCIESIGFGVPIAAWPTHSDQPLNAFVVSQMLKAGLVVREWARSDELVSSSVISDVVKRLMSSDEGNVIRRRAEELGLKLRKSTGEGGGSRAELDSFFAHITRT